MGESLDCNKLYKKDHIKAKVLDEEKSGSRYTKLPVKTKTIYENWKVLSKEGVAWLGVSSVAWLGVSSEPVA